MIRRAALFACALLAATCSQAWSEGTAMELKGNAYPPPAFKAFCAKEKSLCSTRGGSKVVELTSARKAELSKVNVSEAPRLEDELGAAPGELAGLQPRQSRC